MGYAKEKMLVIQNGFDLERFHPDPEARLAVRKELQLSPECKLVGIFARFDPFKDPENFVRAAAHLHKRMPDVHFVMCGREMTSGNNQLVEWIEQAGIRGNCHLLGQCYDVPHWMAAMDVIVSSSQSEGFPNVLGEAMACGVSCVTTDAGDSALIVGNTGKVVPIKEPGMLAQACEALLKLNYEERQTLGLVARQYIEEHFSLATIVHQYEQLYQELLMPQNGKH
jgi:glycosyltransferase involved in cell wall biosynthesis